MNIKEIRYGNLRKDDVDHVLNVKKTKSWKQIPLYIDDYSVYKRIYDAQFQLVVWDSEKKKAVMEFTLEPKQWRGINAYEVQTAFVAQAYQGQGVGFALYQGLINLYDIALLSLGEHSVGARKLWMYLAKDPKIQAYGFDVLSTNVWNISVDQKKKELKSTAGNPKVYGNNADYNGLILVKRNGINDKKLQKLLLAKKSKPKPDVLGINKFNDLSDEY